MSWLKWIGQAVWLLVILALVLLAGITALLLFLNSVKSNEPMPLGGIAILLVLFVILLTYAGSRRRSTSAQKALIQLVGGSVVCGAVLFAIIMGPRSFTDCEYGWVCQAFKPLPSYSFEVALALLGLPLALTAIRNGVYRLRNEKP